MRLTKVSTTIDKLSIIWKSDLWMHHMDAGKAFREKERRGLHKNATSYTEQNLEATVYETATIRLPNSNL